MFRNVWSFSGEYPLLGVDVWTRADHMKRWFAPSDEYTHDFIEVDPRVGGRFRVAYRKPDLFAVVGGEYLTVDPPEKLAFTWAWEAPHPDQNQTTMVTVEFRECPEGTELTLIHDRFPNDVMRDKHESGWAGTLDRLERLLRQLSEEPS